MADTRKKACPNEECITYMLKKYDSKIKYCPECGTKLIYVCKSRNCYKPLVNSDPRHCYCAECQSLRDDRLNKLKDNAKKGAKIAGGVAVAVATPAIKVIEKDGGEALKKVAKTAVNVVANRISK